MSPAAAGAATGSIRRADQKRSTSPSEPSVWVKSPPTSDGRSIQ